MGCSATRLLKFLCALLAQVKVLSSVLLLLLV
jgi:hypothetical protein